jgi:hypothetical protein
MLHQSNGGVELSIFHPNIGKYIYSIPENKVEIIPTYMYTTVW